MSALQQMFLGTTPVISGQLWAWGRNTTGIGQGGQLGLGNLTNYSSPKQVGALTAWFKLSSGFKNSLAIKADGTLWAWGQNASGQIGDGTTTNRNSPVQVGALTSWVTVASSYHSLAIKTDGTLWAWGSGGFGALGLGNATSYSSPMQVGALTTWATVAPGGTLS